MSFRNVQVMLLKPFLGAIVQVAEIGPVVNHLPKSLFSYLVGCLGKLLQTPVS